MKCKETDKEEILETYNNLIFDYQNCSCFGGCRSCATVSFDINAMENKHHWLLEEWRKNRK